MKDSRPSDLRFGASLDAPATGRNAARTGGWMRPPGAFAGCAALSFLLGLSYYFPAQASLGITADPSLSALAWPAPAMGVALLWRRRVREWPLYLLLAAGALALQGMRAPSAWSAVDVMLAVLTLLQVVLGAWLGRRWIARDGRLDSSRRLLLFALLLPVGLSMLHSTLAGAVLWWGSAADWLAPWRGVFVAAAVAMLTLVPALLAWGTPAVSAVLRERSNWSPIAVTFACLALVLIPGIHDEVVRTALTLPLCWAAVRGGIALVAPLNAAIAIGMVCLTLAGFGPYVEYGYGLWTLQVDLIGIAVLSLLLAVSIGERQRMAARLDQARRFESLGFLAGGVAHDFNNVLGTIRACAEIAGERIPPDGPGQAELAQLARATDRGIDMTQQILLAARQGDPTRECVDLGALIDEAIEMARPLCPSHIRIARAPTPGHGATEPSPLVLAHRGQLLRAVQNLLRNAVQAARQQVTLTVGAHSNAARREDRFDIVLGDPWAHEAGAHGWVEVLDDGHGIAAVHWPHLFDPFYSTRQAQGGSGLGLAIVAGVASGHGGFVGMATAPGRGSLFRLEVPLFDTAVSVPPLERRSA
ncbi:ATP-binding protein [Variovorax sp. W2I14]|uniref:ATP-binding protein n=1 Tax=Variovorax sp. W2I14 TaxID=3042290 RepID=UPI003D197199